MVKKTMISMARRMKNKSLKDNVQVVSSTANDVNLVYAVVVCRKDPDSPYYDMAVAKYDFKAALGTETRTKTKKVHRNDFLGALFGWTKEVTYTEEHQVRLTAEQGEMLMDTYVPHKLLVHLKNQGMVRAITYCD